MSKILEQRMEIVVIRMAVNPKEHDLVNEKAKRNKWVSEVTFSYNNNSAYSEVELEILAPGYEWLWWTRKVAKSLAYSYKHVGWTAKNHIVCVDDLNYHMREPEWPIFTGDPEAQQKCKFCKKQLETLGPFKSGLE